MRLSMLDTVHRNQLSLKLPYRQYTIYKETAT
jgi:hypothetical protein